MPTFGPISRRNLIRTLRRLNFDGPFSGSRHQYMERGEVQVIIPNPHQGDISRALLATILKQAEISREEWEKL